MSKAVMYGINRGYIPNTQADRMARHWVSQTQRKNSVKGDLFRKVLEKKLEEKNG